MARRTGRKERKMGVAEPGNADPAADLGLSESQLAAISKLARDEVVIRPPIWLAKGAHVRNDSVDRSHAEMDPAGFWAERAHGLDWIEPWTDVFRLDLPRHEWFVGGKLNAA